MSPAGTRLLASELERQRRRSRRLALITRVSRTIASGLELGDLLQKTIRALRDDLGYSRAVISLIDPRDRGSYIVRAIGGERGGLRVGFRLPISEGISGAAIRTQSLLFVSDVRRDPRYYPCRGMPRGRVAALAVPILVRGETLGVLNVERREPFAAEDGETLQLVSEHLAVAILNAEIFEREKLRARRLSLISRIGQIAATGHDRRDLLQRAADSVHELLGYQNIDIPTLDPDDPGLLVFEARGGAHKRIRTVDRIPVTEGVIGAAVRDMKTQLVNDVRKDPRYVPPPLDIANRAELVVPIVHGGRALGALNVEGDSPFDADDASSLQIVADHLAVALHNAELHEKGRRDAVHEERRRLSRDLHDSVTQLLFSLSLLAQSLGSSWRRSPEEGERKAERMVELAGAALREMRALVGALYPEERANGADRPAPPRISLPARLREFMAPMLEGGPRISFATRDWTPQAPEVEEALFRVSQEAIGNAIKHARARSIRVFLAVDRRAARLRIVDDGVGFRPRARRRPRRSRGAGGLGLGIMESRVREQGGRFSLESAPGGGTVVDVRLSRRDAIPARETFAPV